MHVIPLVAGVTDNPFLLRTMLWFAACNFHAFVAFSICATAVPKRKRFKNIRYLFHKRLNCAIKYVYDKMLLVSVTKKIDVLLETGPMVYHAYLNRVEGVI